MRQAEAPKCLLYVRVSTDMQQSSVETQEKTLREEAKRHDYVVAEGGVFTDEDVSGTLPLEERPGLRALFERLDDPSLPSVSAVIVDDPSRLSREGGYSWAAYLHDAQKLGVRVYFRQLDLWSDGQFAEVQLAMHFRQANDFSKTLRARKQISHHLCSAA